MAIPFQVAICTCYILEVSLNKGSSVSCHVTIVTIYLTISLEKAVPEIELIRAIIPYSLHPTRVRTLLSTTLHHNLNSCLTVHQPLSMLATPSSSIVKQEWPGSASQPGPLDFAHQLISGAGFPLVRVKESL